MQNQSLLLANISLSPGGLGASILHSYSFRHSEELNFEILLMTKVLTKLQYVDLFIIQIDMKLS